MTSDPNMFAGIAISSGRKPITFVGLDEELRITRLEKWDRSEVLACLQSDENSSVGIHRPSTRRGEEIYADLKANLVNAGFQPFSLKTHPKQWLETEAQDCFHALGGHKLLPRRSLEGRLQRCAILYEQGLQLTDPVDMFEEITRYRLIQGILPLDDLPSPDGLDALAAAYVAWMSVNRPARIVPKAEFVLPASE